MKRKTFIILLFCWVLQGISAQTDTVCSSIGDVIEHIYTYLYADDDTYYTELEEELLDLASHPIALNTATYDELCQLPFLNGTQIDNILLYIHHHPLQSLSELRLIDGMEEYDVHFLLPFVCLGDTPRTETLPAAKVLREGKHEIIMRADVRDMEGYEGDPVYVQLKYKFNYKNRVQYGLQLRREPGTRAADMRYGGYIQLNDIGHLHTLVAGNYQGQFGMGIVMSNRFHRGKNDYVLSAGTAQEGLRRYTSVDGEGLHGAGATLRFGKVDVSGFYSFTRSNDSLLRHVVGGNVTFHYRQLKVGVTAIENIYSDTLRYYNEHAAYNQNYFRGVRQAVIGANARWYRGKVDLFGEIAAAQNKQWGVGIAAGMRITPISDIGLMALYRYYSPHFDNTLGYAFGETVRINDENGLYLSTEIRRLTDWRFSVYADGFYFTGKKYGISYAPSWGYDVGAQADYMPANTWTALMQVRAKGKGGTNILRARGQMSWSHNRWKLQTRIDANFSLDAQREKGYGMSIAQDVHYTFAKVPLVLQLRVQGFDARTWDNRIYLYENDVLYANSTPATYGIGGRVYVNMRWQIIKPLGLYVRLSETIYARTWEMEKGRRSRGDIHVVMRWTIN